MLLHFLRQWIHESWVSYQEYLADRKERAILRSRRLTGPEKEEAVRAIQDRFKESVQDMANL